MRTTTWTVRALAAATGTVLLTAGLVGAGTAPATAGEKASTRYLLSNLDRASEHTRGYDRDLFTHWVDADGDGCDARDEVLLAEAVKRPQVGSGCALSGGAWRSRFDRVRTSDPSRFDVDHMVALNEAWQSGAWKWSSATRRAYANDLGYRWSLNAVTSSSNRSKGDREPHAWLPDRGRCQYVAQWVAVKWRWQLTVDGAERRYLRRTLKDCGWPRVPKPTRASLSGRPGGSGGGGAGGTGGGACAPGYSPCVPPYPSDVDCADVDGPIYVTGSDPHRLDADGDGVACET
jgi:hypothetical protein